MRWGAALSSQSCSRCCVWLGCRVERPACSPSCTASDHTGWVALLLQLQQQRDEPLQLQRGVNAAGSFAVRAITASDCARLCMLLIEGRPEPQRTRRQPVRPPSCQGHPCLVRLGLTDQQQPHLAPSLTSVPVLPLVGCHLQWHGHGHAARASPRRSLRWQWQRRRGHCKWCCHWQWNSASDLRHRVRLGVELQA